MPRFLSPTLPSSGDNTEGETLVLPPCGLTAENKNEPDGIDHGFLSGTEMLTLWMEDH